jgi:TonB-dependent receptor
MRTLLRSGRESRPRQHRLSLAIAVVLIAAGAPLVHAQSVDSSDAQNDNAASVQQARASKHAKTAGKATLGTIVVTGIRASIESSVQQQRTSGQIVHSVTASDISSMPDRTITEVLQRIPGVTMDKFIADDDPDHPSSEGSGVLIRGLPYVESLLNGAEVFSADNGRSLSFEEVPAELMGRVSVYPDPSANMIEGGIGGVVDLQTRMPFDIPGRRIAFSVDANWGDLSRDTKPEASFLFSNQWRTNAGRFGFTLDLASSELASTNQGIQVNPYVLRPDSTDLAYYAPSIAAGSQTSNVFVPEAVNWEQMNMLRKRNGIYGAFQWSSPNDKLSAYSRFFRSTYNLKWDQYWVQTNENNYNTLLPAPGTQFTYSSDGVFESGTMISNAWKGSPPAGPNGNVEYYATTRQNNVFTSTTDWSNGFQYDISDSLQMSGQVQFVKSFSNLLSFSVYNQFFMPPATISVTGSKPTLTTADPSFFTNPANYYMAAAMDHLEHDYALQRTARVDFDYFPSVDWLKNIQFGLRATNSYSHSNNGQSNYNWGPISQVWQGAYTGPDSLAWANTIPGWMEQPVTLANFYRGATLPTTLWFPSLALVGNYYGAIPALKAIEMPNSGSWQPQQVGQQGDDNYMSEKTQAAYVQLEFAGNLGVSFDGNAGIRFVSTQVYANGSILFPASTSIQGNVSSLTPEQLAFFKGILTPLEGSTNYRNWLPSLNLTFHLTDDLQARFAASRAMTRPPISQLNSYMQLGASWGGLAGQQASFQGFTGSSGGNPELKPMTANQGDATLEWYFGGPNMVFADVFYKNIHNFINTSVVSTQNIEGQPIAVTGPLNAGNGIVRGIQLGYSQFFTFLPGAWKGIGIQANYTFLRASNLSGSTSCDPNHANGSCSSEFIVSNPALPMPGMSPHNYNLILMYQHADWSARLAWSWRSQYLISTEDSGDTYLPVWSGAAGQLDGTIFYKMTKHLQLGLILNNLNNSTTKVLMGPSTYAGASANNPTTAVAGYVDEALRMRSMFTNDRRAEIVLRGSF